MRISTPPRCPLSWLHAWGFPRRPPARPRGCRELRQSGASCASTRVHRRDGGGIPHHPAPVLLGKMKPRRDHAIALQRRRVGIAPLSLLVVLAAVVSPCGEPSARGGDNARSSSHRCLCAHCPLPCLPFPSHVHADTESFYCIYLSRPWAIAATCTTLATAPHRRFVVLLQECPV